MITADRIEKLDGATVQHGPLNDRIYVMHPGDADARRLPEKLQRLAERNGYTKIFAKIPESSAPAFLDRGYIREAIIPGFFKGEETAFFLGRFLAPDRRRTDRAEEIEQIAALALDSRQKKTALTPENISIGQCSEQDADAMSDVYREIFPTYPFPIDDPGYLKETMRSHVTYFAARHEEKIVALASSETDQKNATVEMTDFATLPAWRGRSLASLLLRKMESAMRRRGLITSHTIARALSPGMNVTFAKAGYLFGGTLVNNTNISGSVESMNVWYKRIG
ncbi:putative beta-lysine N-acetyltransferase [Prosthecochloris sp. GSB1]|uniref:putative beta-lysine N-acetyltransferase n=1 Tax=Prosthecochloris sp. GSB1 TaxID=281093 RepID=UPI001EEF4600|nr:putative beta-lysine N-acetyltransferase [Prosthecochloris sp. GSB1]